MQRVGRKSIFVILFLLFLLMYSGVKLNVNTVKTNINENSPRISKSLTITSPNSETSWEVGTTQEITWTCSDDVGIIQIDLYRENSYARLIGTVTDPSDGHFTWEIPDYLIGSSTYQIKIDEVIIDLFSPFTVQFSDEFEIINENPPDSITITNPTGSSSWEAGSTQTITWTTTENVGNIDIDLYKDDIFLRVITPLYTNNDGSYSWTIPNSLEYGTDYQIKIAEYFNNPVNDFSEYFEIYENTETESFAVTSPTGSSSWKVGTIHSITWTSTGNINRLDIDLYKDDTFIETITSYTSNDGSYSWNIPNELEYGSDYQINVYKYGDESIKDFSVYFEIKDDEGSGTDSESITVTNPTSSSSWKVGSSQIIAWDSTGDISKVTIDLYDNNYLKESITESVANSGNYIWKIPNDLKLGSNYQTKISKYQDTPVYGISEFFELSDYIYIGQNTITINNPNKLTSWKAGSAQTILWIASEKINNVAIDLYNDNYFVETIAIITSNDGSYTWEIPTHLNEETTYCIIISDFIDLTIFGMSELFSISNDIITNNDNNSNTNYNNLTDNTITFINPTANSIWKQGNQSLIQWNYNYNSSNIDTLIIKLYKGDLSILAVVQEESIQDQYLLVIPETIEDGDDYRIYIQLWHSIKEIHKHSEFFTISREQNESSSNNYISGYNLFFVFGIISLISLVLLKKYRK